MEVHIILHFFQVFKEPFEPFVFESLAKSCTSIRLSGTAFLPFIFTSFLVWDDNRKINLNYEYPFLDWYELLVVFLNKRLCGVILFYAINDAVHFVPEFLDFTKGDNLSGICPRNSPRIFLSM